jgi:hypothetical protein
MINANLIGLCNIDANSVMAVCHINNNECVVDIKMNELSTENQDKILEILNQHFSTLGTKDLANKLLDNYN